MSTTRRYDVYEDAEFGTMREYCETGCHVDADDYAALQESHARLLESMINARALFSYYATDEVQQLWLKQTNEAIAAAKPFEGN